MLDGYENIVRFKTKVDKNPTGWWSFGVCLSHQDKETYVYINFFKWSISIGFMYDDYWQDWELMKNE